MPHSCFSLAGPRCSKHLLDVPQTLMLFVGAAHPALGTLLVQPQLALLGVQLQLRVSALGKAGCGSPGREPSQPSLCFQSLEWFVYGTL